MIATNQQALLLWSTSWLTCYSSIQAYKKELPDLSFATGCVFITSLLYWRNPRNNWIRILDMGTSASSILYHIWKSVILIPHKNRYPFYLLGTFLLYPTSWYCYQHKKYWLSFYLHALMHICGNASNLYLYNRISNSNMIEYVHDK